MGPKGILNGGKEVAEGVGFSLGQCSFKFEELRVQGGERSNAAFRTVVGAKS